MKAKNSKEVTRSYILFAIALAVSILSGVGCVWFFLLTSTREVTLIEQRAAEYDVMFEHQAALTEKVDSVYHSLKLLGSDQRLNETVLQNRISSRKRQLQSILSTMPAGDALLYSRLLERIKPVLEVKDSIRILTVQAEVVKDELNRCIHENKETTRRMMYTNPSR